MNVTDSPLAGRIALVTGSSRGIGRAIAVALAEAGADIAVNYRSRAETVKDTRTRIETEGGHAIAVQADVSEATEIDRLVDTVEADLGTIDILVNNAGIARQQTVEDLTKDDWDAHLATNLTAAFLLSQAVIPAMREQEWGRIVNISSVAASNGGIIGPHYAASKAGLLGLTRGYARRLAGEGVTVNAIAPALIETGMIEGGSATPEMVPVGRFGTPEEVAMLAQLLTTNGYITGQTFNVDGGIDFS